jgi:hypothetical protein
MKMNEKQKLHVWNIVGHIAVDSIDNMKLTNGFAEFTARQQTYGDYCCLEWLTAARGCPMLIICEEFVQKALGCHEVGLPKRIRVKICTGVKKPTKAYKQVTLKVDEGGDWMYKGEAMYSTMDAIVDVVIGNLGQRERRNVRLNVLVERLEN